jgi:hypothetical protein
MHRLQERSAQDLFSHDATSWMDLVQQLDALTCGPASGSPLIVMVQSTHDRKSDDLLACLVRGKS